MAAHADDNLETAQTAVNVETTAGSEAKTQQPQPEKFTLSANNPISGLTFFWIFRLLWKCLSLGPDNVRVSLDKPAGAELASNALSAAWDDQPQTLLQAAFKSFGTKYVLLGLWKVAWAVCTWLCAYYLLQQLMIKATYGLAIGLLAAAVCSAVTIQRFYQGTYLVGLRLRAALIDMVYKKAMVLSPANVNIGHIMTLVANDIETIAEAATQFHFLWSGCIEVIGIMVIAWILAGWRSTLAPILFTVAIIMPIQVYLGKLVSKSSSVFFKKASERLHLMTEILTAIKLIKFYAWEDPARAKVEGVRADETKAAALQTTSRAINFALVFAGPVIASLSCLLVLQVTGSELDPVLAFTLVSLFNTLRYPLLMMPLAVKSCSSALNAFRSLDNFLRKGEMVDQRDRNTSQDGEVVFRDVHCKWEQTTTDTLQQISLEVGPGEILAVIGDVGSGKSSLVAAMLGQMKITSGSISARGLMSYCPQEAWLINSTLQDNILFGSEMDERRYADVIAACSLERDLSLFPEGDQVAISERGANLSGGQRQRVSMARAVYSHSDIVLLDDPLSALDQAVGRHIFDNCFKTYLKDRAVVLVTHQLQYLPECSRIAIMDKGRVIQYGTYSELMAEPESRLRDLMTQFSDVENNTVPEKIDEELIRTIRLPTEELSATRSVDVRPDLKPGPLSEVELTEVVARDSKRSPAQASLANVNKITRIAEYNSQVMHYAHTVDEALLVQKAEFEHQTLFGPNHLRLDPNGRYNSDFSRTVAHNMLVHLTTVTKPIPLDDRPPSPISEKSTSDNWVTYKRSWLRYLRKAGGGLYASIAIFVFFWIAHMFRVGSDIWVKVWQGKRQSDFVQAYSMGPTTDAIIYAIIVTLFALCVAIRGIWWSTVSSRKARHLHDSMLHSLIRAPMAFYDKTPLGRILQSSSKHQADADDRLPDSLMQFMQYLPLAVCSLVIMVFQSSMILTMIGVVVLLFAFGIALISFTRKSGATVHFTEQQALSKTILFSHITTSLEGLFSIRAFRCQDRFRTKLLESMDNASCYDYVINCNRYFVALYVDILCSLAIFFNALFFVYTPADSATVGLSLSNALQLLVFVQWTLRMWEETQVSILSVGNLQYFSEKIPAEAPAIIKTSRPQENWPTEGRIDFHDVVLRYTTFGVAVLKKINFTIQSREKIGIVGRTGSGKSTLLVALLRIVELAAGRIVIDGLDISTIGLEDLRRKVAIIPQESVLFSGTIRENLDPTKSCSDDAIWKALVAVNLADSIRGFACGLDAQVASEGARFSLGQRQLFCIARAILMKSRVVVLDEATAAIDAQTDALVQKAITENFADCTVLTIAHRLNTIIQSDRILMMNAGKVVEFDKPFTLLSNPNGQFYDLVEQTGPETARKLRQLAQEKFERDCEIKRNSETGFLSQLQRPQTVTEN